MVPWLWQQLARQQAEQGRLDALRQELTEQHTVVLREEQQRLNGIIESLNQDLAAAVDTAEAMRLVVTQLTKQASQSRAGVFLAPPRQ